MMVKVEENFKRVLFVGCVVGAMFVGPALALFGGIVFALLLGNPFLKYSKRGSKFLLQFAVVGLGFGMNLHDSLRAGADGMIFTIVSVVGVMGLGVLLGWWLGLKKKLAYLISSGTAICGGSAIAAIAPVVGADDDETTMSLATIFTLNAVALFVFPALGHLFALSEHQFGLWSAIAIHDTSSVVGAASAYGQEALVTATTVKLTRALWIIPLALVSMFFFKSQGRKLVTPWFIFLFVLAMIFNTYVDIPVGLGEAIGVVSHGSLSVTLFLIGGGLSLQAIRNVGARPLILGVILWVVISVVSLIVILY